MRTASVACATRSIHPVDDLKAGYLGPLVCEADLDGEARVRNLCIGFVLPGRPRHEIASSLNVGIPRVVQGLWREEPGL